MEILILHNFTKKKTLIVIKTVNALHIRTRFNKKKQDIKNYSNLLAKCKIYTMINTKL